MKKYLLLVVIVIILLIIQLTSKSYGYENCNNRKINSNNLNSLDLYKYLKENYQDADINYFCSYNNCYYVKNEGLAVALQNFLLLQKQKGLIDYVQESEIKGFPITEISLNLCS